MSNQTGQLGTQSSRPGQLELGVGPSVAPTITIVSSNITVAETITLVVHGLHFQTIIETVSIAETIAKTITNITSARVTQDVLEVVYAGVVTARVTQAVIEVVYKKATVASVTDAITVTSTPTTQFVTYRKTVTSAITLVEAIAFRENVTHKTVAQPITVTETIGKVVVHGSTVNITVHDSIGVSETRSGRNNVIRMAVVTSIAVAVPESDRDATQRQSLTNTIHITEVIGFNDPIKHVTVHDTITVTPTVSFKENPLHITVTSAITVTASALGISNRPLKRVTDNITVTSTPTFFTGRLTRADAITVGSLITFTRTPIRITVTDPITVTTTPGNRNNNRRLSVEDTIFIPQFFTDMWPAIGRVSPNHQTYTDNISTSLAIAGGSPIHHVSLTTSVVVTEAIKQNRFFLSVFDAILATLTIAGGKSQRSISVSDAITVSDTARSRTSPNSQSVADLIKMTATNIGIGPRVFIAMIDSIHINEQFRNRINLGNITVTDAIHVGEPLANHGTVRARYTDSITVSEVRRANGPKRNSVTDTITVTSRPKLLSQSVKHSISLAEERHRIYTQSVTDAVSVATTTHFKQTIVRRLLESITVTPTIIRAGVFVVNVADTMIIPESQYLLPINGGEISLPSGRGTLVSNMLTMTSNKGAIVLPAAQLGNQRSNVESVIVQRSMNAKTVTLIKSSDREKLKLSFRISLRKSFELRQFIIDNISEIITLTNWDGDVWVGFIMNNPFEQTHAGRSAPVEGEFVNVEVDFEGVKS